MKETEKSRLVILGTGGFAEEIADYIHGSAQWALCGFVEGVGREKCGTTFLGQRITWIDDVPSLHPDCVAVCAVGSTRREGFIRRAREGGLRFTTIVHPSAQVFPSARIAEGAIIGPGVIIGARTTIGAHTIVNRGCLIGHHVEIGAYVTLGPGCNLAAKVKVGNGTYVGMGAALVPGVELGAGCEVLARALVARNVEARMKVGGAPARVLARDVDRV